MSADLDKAIDRAVREMLDVEPRADLRARVVARIDEPRSSFQLAVPSLQRFALVVGAAAVLVLVLVLVRRAEPPSQPPATAGVQVPEKPPVVIGPQPPVGVPAVQTLATTAKSAVAQESPRVAYAASADATAAAAIDPLKAITPIEVAPIAQSSITPEPIGVHPLDPITEMQIAPLSPPDRRD